MSVIRLDDLEQLRITNSAQVFGLSEVALGTTLITLIENKVFQVPHLFLITRPRGYLRGAEIALCNSV